jgi:hypothetical protein
MRRRRACYREKLDTAGATFPVHHLPGLVVGEWAKLAYALTLTRGC